jgi:hypothetical protein
MGPGSSPGVTTECARDTACHPGLEPGPITSGRGKNAVHKLKKASVMDDLTRTVVERGDLAHLALFLWASGASALAVFALRELATANRRYSDFVNEIAHLNRLFGKGD